MSKQGGNDQKKQGNQGVFANVSNMFGAGAGEADASKNFEFQVKYFPVDDGVQDVAGADPAVYAQFEAVLTREQYAALTGEDAAGAQERQSN
jgi:hypothetical protein